MVIETAAAAVAETTPPNSTCRWPELMGRWKRSPIKTGECMMTLEWRYAEPLDKDQLSKIEEHFGLSLPDDYKASLETCNRGKPTLE